MNKRFRDIKRQARRTLHDHLSEAAWYVPADGGSPVPVSVRLHLSFDALGQLVSQAFGERADMSPRIVFMGAEVKPSRNGIVVTQDMGGFNVDYDYAPDDITITAEVTVVTDTTIAEKGWDKNADWFGLGTPGAT